MFKNRVLRWMFGPDRDEVTGEWGKLHNEELYDLYSSPRRVRWEGQVAGLGEKKCPYSVWW